MKKQVIAIATVVILASQNSAMAFLSFFGAGAADLGASVPTELPTFWGSPSPPPKEPSPPQHYVELLELTKKLLEINTKKLQQAEKIHKSITGNRKLNPKQQGDIQTDQTSFFLNDPHLIYDKSSNVFVFKPKSFSDILKEEKIPDSLYEARESIEGRKQYATVVDKAVSLQAFQHTDARLKQILALLEQIHKTTDLKHISELQAHMKGMLAIIQNENTKLQMVAHLRETEREFIKQQKYKRNMKILNSKNTKMPTIHFIQ
ncbi:type IV secretion system protein [Bartonella machadoae]|uniref:type IV secretion system protein n=1 Tax=Bartonella machadoae TaxID=2893471 RepID=UPI001F4CA795|nr:type IV secretion system protein [Bartonella machadoae]UNE54090.1 conjugal transfer protein [Bartonella machadoae]